MLKPQPPAPQRVTFSGDVISQDEAVRGALIQYNWVITKRGDLDTDRHPGRMPREHQGRWV